MKEKIAEDTHVKISTYMEQQHWDIRLTMDFEVATGDKVISLSLSEDISLVDTPEELIERGISNSLTRLFARSSRYLKKAMFDLGESPDTLNLSHGVK
jgi:hypothetical protein